MKKENKYTYYWVIQGYYAGYWEDESFYDKAETSYREVVKDLHEYNLATRAPHRIIERRELKEVA